MTIANIESITSDLNAFASTLQLEHIHLHVEDGPTWIEAAGKAVRFLLVPQTSEEVTLKIEIGGKTVEHTLAGLNEVLKNATQEIPAALDGGKCLTLNLTFGKDGIVVEGSQIGGWEDQGTVDGDISM